MISRTFLAIILTIANRSRRYHLADAIPFPRINIHVRNPSQFHCGVESIVNTTKNQLNANVSSRTSQGPTRQSGAFQPGHIPARHTPPHRIVTSALGFLLGTAKRARRLAPLAATADDLTSLEGTVALEIQPNTESVHMKLGSVAMTATFDDSAQEGDDEEAKTPTSSRDVQNAVFHTYHDPIANISLSGFNVSKRRFQAWVNHTLHTTSPETIFNSSLVVTTDAPIDDTDFRNRLRRLWRERRLLSDRTEVLAVYESDKIHQQSNMISSGNSATVPKRKRGGFPDLLHIYADRLSAIIEDELEEARVANGELRVFNRTDGTEEPIPHDVVSILNGGLLGWLQREYGFDETQRLCASHMQQISEPEQRMLLQSFMEWFRSRFPYYYDRCDSCGASAKDDPLKQANEDVDHDDTDSDDEKEEEEDDDGTFLGYVYPSRRELLGKASRTEIYQCHKCGSFTRFPRYNAASSVMINRRGRCGEYSMLLYRLLRATGHEARWVVDWADHVWAEIGLNGKWIHLDPCEAAVDKPFLYQEWGKQQTYIVAFHAPNSRATTIQASMNTSIAAGNGFAKPTLTGPEVPIIEDVTGHYTSDEWEAINKRREDTMEEIMSSLARTAMNLENQLKNLIK